MDTPTKTPIRAPSATASTTSHAHLAPSPAYVTSVRSRHAVYGNEDRIVLDLGSTIWKAGFSAEPKPRVVISIQDLCDIPSLRTLNCGNVLMMKERIQNGLRRVFFDFLMTDPKLRRVILVEDSLLPFSFKCCVSQVLFENLGVPSISFAPSALLSLLACGRVTGLVVDVGHLECCVTPVFSSRPMFPLIRSTPRAGSKLNERLKQLLIHFAWFLPTPSVETLPPTPQTPTAKPERVPIDLITDQVVEDIKTKICFVGHSMSRPKSTQRSPSNETFQDFMNQLEQLYSTQSTSNPITYRLPTTTTKTTTCSLPKGTLFVPGWIRERCSEILFATQFELDGEEEEESVVEVVLESILKLPIDLRKILSASIVITGGTCMLRGFRLRLLEELKLTLVPKPSSEGGKRKRRAGQSFLTRRYDSMSALLSHISIINNPTCHDVNSNSKSGLAPCFEPSLLAWIGASLTGAMKISGEEIQRDRWESIISEEMDRRHLPTNNEEEAETGSLSDPVKIEDSSQEVDSQIQIDDPFEKRQRGIQLACGLVPDWTRMKLSTTISL